ncbi:MAG: hypothetical protein CR975_03485 [Gammaproteobacteria bacterium]|nr:MAG: hypothetical protein CR975_03485 [Gammaproteobacteria bacterium]
MFFVGGIVTTKTDITYHKDHSFEQTLDIDFKDKGESLKWKFIESGDWSLVDNTLTQTRKIREVIHAKITPDDGMLAKRWQRPKNNTKQRIKKFKVLVLTDNELQFSDIEPTHCKR